MAKDKVKRSTEDIINDSIAQQNDWLENRRAYTRRFLKSFNMFGKQPENQSVEKDAIQQARDRRSGWRAYWFPIFCAIVVIFIAIWVAFVRDSRPGRTVAAPNIPEAIVRPVVKKTNPSFDVVRIEKNGNIVIAGRGTPNTNISIKINGKIVATERSNEDGEFVYAPTRVFEPGNYTISLIGETDTVKSQDKVFVYISEYGYENSVSLLMTNNGSTLLQAPSMLTDGDLKISKIDYLDSGRIVVTGDALPRLRVSLALNDKYIGFARVSDHKHFGLGADVGALESGKEYKMDIRMHDGDGTTVAIVSHKFTMPEMTGDDDTFYTVRRGDCLWIIARNFMRRGILFSIIAERNSITNPDLIFPKQKLQIPIDGK